MAIALPLLLAALALAPSPSLLTFKDLLQDANGRLAPTPKLLGAAGHRVRMRGFVASLEIPSKGGFWLCPMPIVGDESGGGTADLPPESVFVVVQSSPGTVFSPPRGPVEVSGLLQLGPKALPDGTMTHLRLLLDRKAPKSSPPARPQTRRSRPARIHSKRP